MDELSDVWTDVQDLPVYRCNRFFIQADGEPGGPLDEVVLTLGNVAPPMLPGTPEEQALTASALGVLNVKGIVRVSMNRYNSLALLELLQTYLPEFFQEGEQDS